MKDSRVSTSQDSRILHIVTVVLFPRISFFLLVEQNPLTTAA